MEKTISATEANRNFSALLREVRKGKTYVITSRGERVAELRKLLREPSAEEVTRWRKSWEQMKKRLDAQPALNLPRVTRDEMHER